MHYLFEALSTTYYTSILIHVAKFFIIVVAPLLQIKNHLCLKLTISLVIYNIRHNILTTNSPIKIWMGVATALLLWLLIVLQRRQHAQAFKRLYEKLHLFKGEVKRYCVSANMLCAEIQHVTPVFRLYHDILIRIEKGTIRIK